MSEESLIQKLERLPVPLLATMVGAATLSNVYLGLGFSLVRHLTMILGTLVLLVYLVKMVRYPAACIGEYKNTVPGSLYAAFSMLLMILGSYYFDFSPALGKGMWFAGLGIHAIHILIFTWRNVLVKRVADTFVPSWFVTYNGILVSCVVGGVMKEPEILTIVTYYGIAIYFILIPLMIWRLMKFEIKDAMFHTQAVVLAPCSLCVVAYLNVIPEPNFILISILYACVLASLLFVIYKLPKFFSYAFTPGFAGLTFPMAIGIVASTKMSGYLSGAGYEALANVVKQISGIQIYITSGIIAFVLFNFFFMLKKAMSK